MKFSNRFAALWIAPLAVAGVLALAGPADAIFPNCRNSCYGTSPTARCTYYQGDGSCPAYPNPCYMTCAKYWSCTSNAQPAADLSEGTFDTSEITFGQSFDTWLETMSLSSYGPCLDIVSKDSEDALEIAPLGRMELIEADDEVESD